MHQENKIIIYNTEDGSARIALFAKDGMAWMNQNQISELFVTSKQNIGQHILNILKDNELEEESVVKNFFTTAADGKNYNTTHYSLDMILAIGYRVRSKRGTQFRQWATRNLTEYLVKGFVMDDERLKSPGGRPDYFDELLNRIRDIRASETRFYQKVRDLFSLSSDYDPTHKATQMFFAEVQNKFLYAVVGKTAAEIVISRADIEKHNMGLTSWKGKIVRKGDIFTAKNYLTEDEIDSLNRLVVIFLETAELRVKDNKDITIAYWKKNVDRLIEFNDKEVLTHNGEISNAQMQTKVGSLYDTYNSRRKKIEAIQADETDLKDIEALETTIKNRT